MKKFGVLLLLLSMLALPTMADMLTLQFNHSFTPGVPVAGTPLIATFVKTGTNTVQLTLSANSGSAKLTELDFNMNPLKLANLSGSYLSGIADSGYPKFGEDKFKADGDGYYDITFQFPTSGSTLSGTATSVWLFTLSGGGVLNASDFDFVSTHSGGNGEYVAALHWQPASGSSAWMDPTVSRPTPEPASLFLLGTGLAGLALRLRRRR